MNRIQQMLLMMGGGDLPGYYVNATSGNDSNTGKSPAQAWKTIAKVNAATFLPGDNIFFKKGELWREELSIPSAGSAGKPITFRSYGGGAKPKIYGSNVPASWTQEDIAASSAPELVQGPLGVSEADGSVTKAWTSTPIEGNLLVAIGDGSSVIGNASISGWTLAQSVLCGTTHTTAIFYKVAGAGEGSVTLDWTGSTSTTLTLMEWSNVNTLDKVAKSDNTGSVSSKTTGTTASTTANDELVVAALGVGNTVTSLTWSNSFTNRATGGLLDYCATLVVSSTGAQETTASWTTARVAGACIATFKGSGGAAKTLQYATQATDIDNIWFKATDGTIHWGNKVATKTLLLAEYDWWWDDPNNRLYIYAATDPLTRYSSVEVPARERCIRWLVNQNYEYATVDGFEVAFNSGVGIVLKGHSIIKNCYAHHIGTNGVNSVGVELHTSSGGSKLQNNTVHDVLKNGMLIVGSFDPYGNIDSIVERNTVYDCFDTLLTILSNAPQTVDTQGTIVRFNNFYHSASFNPTGAIKAAIETYGYASALIDATQIYCNLINVKKVGIYISDYSTNTVIYNNVAISGEGLGINIIGSTGCSGITIKNNIGVGALGGFKVTDKTIVAACDYNLWFTSGTVYATDNATAYHSNDFAAWKSDTGFDAHGLWEDPKLVSTSDFHLQNSSPCIGAGVNVGLTADYDGVAVGNPPEIGAYEKV
jgi:hypothetical protein